MSERDKILLGIMFAMTALVYATTGTSNEPPQPGIIASDFGIGKTEMFRGGPRRLGVYQGTGPRENAKIAWSFPTSRWFIPFSSGGARLLSSPVISDGVLFFGGWDSAFYALDADTGQMLWRFSTGRWIPFYGSENVWSSPALFDGLVIFGCRDGTVYALRAATGEVEWKIRTENTVTSSPVVSDGVAYFGNLAGYLYAVDAYTGKEVWKHLVDVSKEKVVEDESDINMGDKNKKISAENGTQKAEDAGPIKYMYRGIYSSPAVAEGLIFFGSRDKYFFALNQKTGEIVWRFRSMQGGSSDTTPAVTDGKVYFGTNGGKFHALEAKTGKELWSFETKRTFGSSPAVDQGTIYVGCYDGFLYALDSETGDLKWKYLTGASIISSPAVVDAMVYVGSDDGYMYGLDKNTGEVEFKIETDGAMSYRKTFTNLERLLRNIAMNKYDIRSAPVAQEGTLYFTAGDGSVYAIK